MKKLITGLASGLVTQFGKLGDKLASLLFNKPPKPAKPKKPTKPTK